MMIRPATEADIDVIGQLWLGLITHHQRLDDRLPIPVEDGALRYAARIRYGLNDANFKVYVAEHEGKVIGYVSGSIVDLVPEMFVGERAGMIIDVFVQQSSRNQGVGRALLRVMKDWFKLRGVHYYELYVSAANLEAIRFWKNAMAGEPVMIRMRARVD